MFKKRYLIIISIIMLICLSTNVSAQNYYDNQYLNELNQSLESIITAIWIIGGIIFGLLATMIVIVYYSLVLNKGYLNRIDKLIKVKSGNQYEQNWNNNSFTKYK